MRGGKVGKSGRAWNSLEQFSKKGRSESVSGRRQQEAVVQSQETEEGRILQKGVWVMGAAP